MQKNMSNEKTGLLEVCVCLILPVLLIFVDYGVGTVFNFSPLRMLVIFSALVLMFKYFKGEIKFIPTILFIPFVLLLTSILLSIVNAESKFSVMRGLLIQSGLIIIYYLIIHTVHSRILLQKTLNFLFIASLISCVTAYLQKTSGSYLFYSLTKYFNVYSFRTGIRNTPLELFTFYRPSSFFIDVNTFAFFLVIFLPLFFSLFLYYAISRNRMKYFYFIIIAVEIPILLMTLSRNNWIGGFLGILVVLILTIKETLKNSRIWKWILIFILIGVLPFCSKHITDSIYYRLKEIPKALTVERTGSDNSRLMAMKAGLKAFRQHPVFGIGAGSINFTKFYQKYYEPSVQEWDPHCWPARVAAETGLVGIFANFIFMFFLFREVLKTRGKMAKSADEKDRYWKFFFTGGIGSLMVCLVTSLFGQSFVAEFVYFFFGLIITATYIARESGSVSHNCKP